MSETPPAANRAGAWALGLGILGLALLMAPVIATSVAGVVAMVVAAAVSVTAVVLGINGVSAYNRGATATRYTAVLGIVLGAVASFFWVLALLGLMLGV